MATRALALTPDTNINFLRAYWTGLLNGDQGAPLEMADFQDRSVQITGTFGAGGSVKIEGSNDGTNYSTLTDPQGVALVFTAAGLKQITELVRYLRPSVTAGDGTTSLAAHVLARGDRM